MLYDLDLSQTKKVSNPNFGKIQRKSVEFNPTSVENLKDAPAVRNVAELMEKLTSFLKGKNGKEIILTVAALKDIESLDDAKYRKNEWILGSPDDSDIVIEKQIEAGQVITCIKLDEDKIGNIRFKGDFIGNKDVTELEDLLQGVGYTKDHILTLQTSQVISSMLITMSFCLS